MSKIKEIEEKIKHDIYQLNLLMKERFKEYIKEILLDLNCNYAVWTQHTPYFMDGEPCEFRVNDVFAAKTCPVIRSYIEDSLSDYFFDDSYQVKEVIEEGLCDAKSIEDLNIKHLNDDYDLFQNYNFMYGIFGDHVFISCYLDEDNNIHMNVEENKDHD